AAQGLCRCRSPTARRPRRLTLSPCRTANKSSGRLSRAAFLLCLQCVTPGRTRETVCRTIELARSPAAAAHSGRRAHHNQCFTADVVRVTLRGSFRRWRPAQQLISIHGGQLGTWAQPHAGLAAAKFAKFGVSWSRELKSISDQLSEANKMLGRGRP